MVPAARESLRLAWPLILSNLTVPLLGMVDTAVVGRLDGPHHLGAVALGAAVVSLVFGLFGFLRMGTSGFTAQAFGAGKIIEVKAILVRSSLLAVILGILIVGLGPRVLDVALWVYQVDGPLLTSFQTYLTIRLWGAPAALLQFVLVGWFLGRQDPYLPLLMMVSANCLNALLSVYLVFALDFGIAGVAIATVVADYAGLLIGVVAVWITWQKLGCPNPGIDWLLDFGIILRFLSLSRDLILRILLMQVVFFGFAAIGARQGEVMLAVNAVMMNFFMLQSKGLDGFADAAEAMTGRAIGRGRLDELRQAFHAGLLNGILLTAVLALLFWIYGQLLVNLLTTIDEVRAAAGPFMIYIALMPLVSVVAFICDGVYFGATRGGDLRNSLLISVLIFVAAAALLVPTLGNHGLWLAFLIFMATRGITLVIFYRLADSGADFIDGARG